MKKKDESFFGIIRCLKIGKYGFHEAAPELKGIGRLSGRNVPYPPPSRAPPARQQPPANAHIPAFLHLHHRGTIPDRIVEAAAQAGAVWQCQWWPTPRPSRPAIRDRISAGIVLHFLTAGPSPTLLFLSPFFASKYLLWPRSSSFCRVRGSMVCSGEGRPGTSPARGQSALSR